MCARKQAPGKAAKTEPQEPAIEGQSRRLWTPWRMKYLAHETGEDGCVFCNRLTSGNDTNSLILTRSDHSFVIMNLYPYNTGHVMIVPNRHVPDPQELSSDELADFAGLLPGTLTALRRVLNPGGFNVGMNIGAVAGAGVADHLHQHVVPRWQGDANFMPIIAGVMVVPELIQATYAKFRAEFERARPESNERTVSLVILNRHATKFVVTNDRCLPSIAIKPHQAVFHSAADYARSLGLGLELVGWAGSRYTIKPGRLAFAYLAQSAPDLGKVAKWLPINAADKIEDHDRETVQLALELDLSIAVAPPQ